MHTNTPTLLEQQQNNNILDSAKMATSKSKTPIISTLVAFLFILSSLSPPVTSEPVSPANQTFRHHQDLKNLKRIRSYLRQINKPAVKTIKSPDGDIINCVKSHLQPAFDHPRLKGQKPLEPAERPKGHKFDESVAGTLQAWTEAGESCPEGTIPIRRTTEQDVLRANSVRRFGRKIGRGVCECVC